MKIRKAQIDDMKQISNIRPAIYKKMIASGLNQWDEKYPSDEILLDDINNSEMFVALIDDEVAGYITVNEDIPDEYKTVDLKFDAKLCVHRLSINPKFSRQGIGTKMMEYVHGHFKDMNYTAICLDTCEANLAALRLYDKLGYITRGYVNFPRRPQYRFPVMEIML